MIKPDFGNIIKYLLILLSFLSNSLIFNGFLLLIFYLGIFLSWFISLFSFFISLSLFSFFLLQLFMFLLFFSVLFLQNFLKIVNNNVSLNMVDELFFRNGCNFRVLFKELMNQVVEIDQILLILVKRRIILFSKNGVNGIKRLLGISMEDKSGSILQINWILWVIFKTLLKRISILRWIKLFSLLLTFLIFLTNVTTFLVFFNSFSFLSDFFLSLNFLLIFLGDIYNLFFKSFDLEKEHWQQNNRRNESHNL